MPKCPKCGATLSALDETRYTCPNCHATYKRTKRAQDQPAAGQAQATMMERPQQAPQPTNESQAYQPQADTTPTAEAYQQSAYQQPVYSQNYEQPAYDQSAYQQTYEPAAYEQQAYQQSAYQQTYEPAAYEQQAYQQSAYQQTYEPAAYEQQGYDQSAYGQPVYSQNYEQPAYEQSAYGQTYEQTAAAQTYEQPAEEQTWAPVPEGTTPCLKIEGLSKKYPQASRYAVRGLSIVCYPGEIVGLLGHNGAGKSTTLKCLTGMLPFEEGKIEINGFDIKQNPVKAKYTFGFVSDKHDVFVKMTGVQYVNFMADAYGVSKKDRQERLVELDKVFTLGDRLRDPINSYSHGMRQKVCMLGSLIHYPKLWIMDEPMIGLDPVTSARVSAFMLEYAARGNCILFSSHNISSVQKLCKRAIIINHGNKTDDFEFADFIRMNPEINLEDYFLYRTQGDQGGDGSSEVAQ